MTSNEHGRVARDMKTAFGPYTNHALQPMPEPMHLHDKIVLCGCALVMVAFVFLVLL